MSSAKPGVKRMSVTSAFTTEADAQLASMMHIQACCRRFVVLARVKRAKRAQEVARRKRRLQSSLSDADFVVGTQLLELFATHTEESTHQAVSNIPSVQRNRVMRTQATNVQKLMHLITSLTRLSSARTVGAVCEEAAVLLLETIDASSCDVYPVETSGDESYVNVNERLHLNLRLTPLIARAAAHDGPIAFREMQSPASPLAAEPLSAIEWYEAAHGTQEMLIRASDEERLMAMLHERKLRGRPVPHRARDAHHALLLAIHSSDGARNADGTPRVVAVAQLVRGAEYGPNPFESDEQHLCAMPQWNFASEKKSQL